MVAVESGSMEPNMEVGDLVFVTEPGRLAPDAADNDVGVVTHEVGETVDYRTFGSYGSVVIYRPPGRTASPIIHRAMFHVEEGENWYDRADDEYHNAADCGDLNHCPAPHDGFITLGDNNGAYDQANGLAAPVKADWVTGVARVRVPYLGYVRLIATGQAEPGDVVATTVAVQPGGGGVDAIDGEIAPGAKATVSGGDTIAGAAG
jgi:signal peptidase